VLLNVILLYMECWIALTLISVSFGRYVLAMCLLLHVCRLLGIFWKCARIGEWHCLSTGEVKCLGVVVGSQEPNWCSLRPEIHDSMYSLSSDNLTV